MRDEALFLRHHLLNWLFTPLYVLFLFSMITGYIAASKLSNESFDMVLIERAHLLSDRYDKGVRDAQLEPAVPGRFYFALFDLQGRVLAANAPLPRPRPQDIDRPVPTRRDAYLEGEKIRLVTLRHSDSQYRADYMLQVAEPVTERQVLGRTILMNVVVPQFMFIAIAALAVWIGLKRGFEPLERLRRKVASRSRHDLSPLDESLAPGEVQPFIHEINCLLGRLKEAMEGQRRFVANAAHQLRTPFAGLASQAELASREEAPPAVRDALAGICKGAQRCGRLVNQLLALARNEPDVDPSSGFIPLDLRLMARECTAHWVPDALKKGIDLGFEGDEGCAPVLGQEAALSDLLDNLVDNAVRYTQPGGHITVSVGCDGGAWLRVEDDGPGIPADMREKVFQRFFRLAGAGQPGSGLGLAIVWEVAERHGASVAVDQAAHGRGTLFTVRFPPADASGETPVAAPDADAISGNH